MIASYLVWWALNLIAREASAQTIKAFQNVAENFMNDPHYDTVRMRRQSKAE